MIAASLGLELARRTVPRLAGRERAAPYRKTVLGNTSKPGNNFGRWRAQLVENDVDVRFFGREAAGPIDFSLDGIAIRQALRHRSSILEYDPEHHHLVLKGLTDPGQVLNDVDAEPA